MAEQQPDVHELIVQARATGGVAAALADVLEERTEALVLSRREVVVLSEQLRHALEVIDDEDD